MIEAIIFDLDGTLIHLPIDYERLIQEFKKVASAESFHPLLEAVSKIDEVTRGQVFKIWDLAELAASAGMTVNQQGMRIYSFFATKPKALITMQGKALVNAILEKLGLTFDVILTREDSLNRAEQLKLAAQKLDASFGNVLFVGNSENDALAAKQVMCLFQSVQ
ncbi:MAG TPA: HAD-IA family hydrolase [Candidatus Bathyarchaeia archaeon]|nr:HAD-IA family hydrolase [Candidatus Bathyarchaeia archaeon]